MEKAYLILENGRVFEGCRIGARSNGLGELVFTTGMCGYLETLTDPSYLGQIVMQTFPLIGNYGVIPEDLKGKCYAAGYVAREICDLPSNFRAQGTLGDYLEEMGIPGIVGVDTRELTLLLRDSGTMNAFIASEVPTEITFIKDFKITNAVAQAADASVGEFSASGESKYKVALFDFGAKHNSVEELTSRCCDVSVFPAKTHAAEVLNCRFDGVLLSEGPGDPAENTEAIAEIQKLLGNIPIFGVGLGHQLLALAAGASTEKLPFGHRGANQPVRDVQSGRTFITSQNHGYTVSTKSLPECAKMRFVNANDKTCEGIDYPSLKAFSVQFNASSRQDPLENITAFDTFISNMEENRYAAH